MKIVIDQDENSDADDEIEDEVGSRQDEKERGMISIDIVGHGSDKKKKEDNSPRLKEIESEEKQAIRVPKT